MILIEKIKTEFNQFLQKRFLINEDHFNNIEFILNIDEAKKDLGDINSNAALIISKSLKTNPKEIATIVVNEFKNKYIEKIEIAGPGFINFFLTHEAYLELIKELFELKNDFFKSLELTQDDRVRLNKNYSIEFVSANPTGPLHFGHGRGGIIGDVLGNILSFLNYKVKKEFYINDAGNQIKKLGESFKIRCQQLLGVDIQLPEDGYQGEYLIDLAKKYINEFGKDAINNPDEFFENYARNYCLERIQQTLADYGIHYDIWFSEKSLHTSGQIKKAIDKLTQFGYTYQKDGAIWFKSTDFGDDKDRVVIKSTGELTYVAADIAYMINKVERGSNHLIMVLGQDHHSYAVRLNGIKQALKLQTALDVILYQLVKMKEGEQLLRMSKRAGRMITLQDIINTVGKDVARFFFLNRKADAQLEFDLDLALKKSEENPVFYIQYAYVRINAILEKAKLEKDLQNINLQDSSNLNSQEYYLIKKIVSLKFLLENICRNYQTHLLSYYLIELASIFHRYYYNNRVIDIQNIQKSRSRLLLTIILKDTFEVCLNLLGISAPEKM